MLVWSRLPYGDRIKGQPENPADGANSQPLCTTEMMAARFSVILRTRNRIIKATRAIAYFVAREMSKSRAVP